MLTVAVIPCTNQKAKIPGKARDVWSGSHFQFTLAHAERYYDMVVILSYKYGLIEPDFDIEPYDINIKDSSPREKLEWWWLLRPQIAELSSMMPDLLAIYTGNYERERIVDEFVKNGVEDIIIPWKGLGIGERMAIVYDDVKPFDLDKLKAGDYKYKPEVKDVKPTKKPDKPLINVNDVEWVDEGCELETDAP